MTFSYVALDPSGKKKSGFIDAADRDAAVAAISSEGRFVVEIRAQTEAAAGTPKASTKGRVGRADVALFTRRLADLSAAGLPLDRVLNVVAEQSESATLAAICEEALVDVRAGSSVSQALGKYPKVFNSVYTQTLRAGEASGQLPDVASRLADFLEKDVARRSTIISALIYPAILAATAVMVIIFLLTFVVPKLAGVFDTLGSDLPIYTRILLGVTGFMTQNYMVLIGGLVAIVVGYQFWVRTEAGSYLRDRFFITSPIIGKVWQKAVLSRYARVLGTLVYGGVPILEALSISGLAAGNKVFQKVSDEVATDVSAGRSIAEAMRDAGDFPPVLVHMVAIGEETGDLPKMLGRVSDSLDFEVDTGMRRLTALVEPIIVLVMGTFVGFVVLSVMLPIYQAQNAVK